MDIANIVKDWLIKNGYDGLYNYECGCVVTDLMPCGDCYIDCKAGYKRQTGQKDHEWIIGPRIEPPKEGE